MSTNLPPLYQRLLDARDAFADFHSYKSPSEALGRSQALVGTVNTLIDAFVLGLQTLTNARSPDEAKPLKAQLENVVDAYVLDLTEGVARLEQHSGESGLRFYVDALEGAMLGEIERCSVELSSKSS